MSAGSGLRLRKHHGLGNDFLILVDLDGGHPVDGEVARALCDRHTGVGADGLIRAARADGAAAAMELYNADGSPAATSGNGLRCLGQALVQTGAAVGPDLVIVTASGPRALSVGPTGPDGVSQVSVDMGVPRVGAEAPGEDPARRSRPVDLGNPHLIVLVPDPDAVDVGAEGAALEARHPGGINVTFAAVTGPDRVSVRTWERGAGLTLACGSGSCATAAALREWGLVGDVVSVVNPGGTVTVDLSGDGALLTGPAQFVATVETA
jgi:diaminopimelate epimerase